MSPRPIRGALKGTFCVLALALATCVPSASAAFDDPLAVIRPVPPQPPASPLPPPDGDLEAPCGIAVDAGGAFYVSEYYRNVVETFSSALKSTYPYGYQGRAIGIGDPLDGPCGLAFDGDGSLYVNDFHRSVLKYDPSLASSTVVAGVGTADGTQPTGVGVEQASGTVYVNQRAGIGVFDSAGTPIRTLGTGTLLDGYGIAVSEYAGSKGLVYVADAATDTVKVYAPEPLTPGAGPVAEIDGTGTPLGRFVSLRDAALAIDRETGQVYVSDNLQPEYAERPETVIHVFDAAGAYQGRLKYSIENAIPPGLAVDNSVTGTQGRVYVTSGNTVRAAIYAYPAGAATTDAVPLPSSATAGFGSAESSAPDFPALTGATGPAPAAPAPAAGGSATLPAAPGSAAARGEKRKKPHRAQRRKAARERHIRHRAPRRTTR
jgi:hypothetical protein